jgi:phosphoribosylamine--glycine ligase
VKKVLILGSGGREHTLAWKLSLESGVGQIHVFPGNAGMAETPKVTAYPEASITKENIISLAQDLCPDLIVVGPENILAMGVADWPELSGFPVLGPGVWCAQLETSKCWASQKMLEWKIPAPSSQVISEARDGEDFLRQSFEQSGGVVIKADGLKAGKGVVVCRSLDDARALLHQFLEVPESIYYSPQVLLQEMLPGPEISLFALCDGKIYLPLGAVQDYKRKFDRDAGPNTGGMGCVSREDRDVAADEASLEQVYHDFFGKVVDGCVAAGKPFVGFLFAGLMKDKLGQWRALEYNVRLGDPETQTLLPLIAEEQFFALLLAAACGQLSKRQGKLKKLSNQAVHVVLTSGGYSEPTQKLSLNHTIKRSKLHTDGVTLFWGGVRTKDDELVNSGGRVVGVTAVASTLAQCRDKAYRAIEQIDFQDKHYRRDIGQ